MKTRQTRAALVPLPKQSPLKQIDTDRLVLSQRIDEKAESGASKMLIASEDTLANAIDGMKDSVNSVLAESFEKISQPRVVNLVFDWFL